MRFTLFFLAAALVIGVILSTYMLNNIVGVLFLALLAVMSIVGLVIATAASEAR